METMLALLIMGVVLLVSIGAISGFIRANRSADDIFRVSAYAQSFLSGILLDQYETSGFKGSYDDAKSRLLWDVNVSFTDKLMKRYDYGIAVEKNGSSARMEFGVLRFIQPRV